MSKLGTLKYRLMQENRVDAKEFGKWYARAVQDRVVEFEDFVEHIAHHNSSFSRGTVNGVMMEPPDNTYSLTVRWAVLRKCGGVERIFGKKLGSLKNNS